MNKGQFFKRSLKNKNLKIKDWSYIALFSSELVSRKSNHHHVLRQKERFLSFSFFSHLTNSLHLCLLALFTVHKISFHDIVFHLDKMFLILKVFYCYWILENGDYGFWGLDSVVYFLNSLMKWHVFQGYSVWINFIMLQGFP